MKVYARAISLQRRLSSMAEAAAPVHLVYSNHFRETKSSSSTTFRPPSFPIVCLSRKHHASFVRKGGSSRAPKRLIALSPSEGRWDGNWNTEYLVSLRDLHLEDLVEDGPPNALVSIRLSVHRHASFGLSVEGRIVTSFTRKCSICSSSYCREIDSSFNVWILLSSRENRASGLPDIGGDDPSVIYVRPGYEAHLDSIIQDAIRLTTSANDTCSDSCEKSEPTLLRAGQTNAASVHKRWSRLLELKKNPTHL